MVNTDSYQFWGGNWQESLKTILWVFKLVVLVKFFIFARKYLMSKSNPISLGSYFDQFVSDQVSAGRYKNPDEVIRAGLRLLENHESKVIALKDAIEEGMNSPRVENFDFDENLKSTIL